MLLQNRIFTAEAPRTQRKHFLFGGPKVPRCFRKRYRQTKRLPSLQYKSQNRYHCHEKGSIFFPKACLPRPRSGPVSAQGSKEKTVSPSWRLCGEPDLKRRIKKSIEINRSWRGFLGKPSSKIEQRTGDFKTTIGRMKAL